MEWFSVDKNGLAKLLARKGKAFMIHELIQNCWDADETKLVEVRLQRISGTQYAELVVQDDSPNGFADLSHAFTLFAESSKKGNSEKRGRFNLGEKLVLAMCTEARITSTTGAIHFDKDGRHASKCKTTHGSEFWGRIKMTSIEIDECITATKNLLVPQGIKTIVNGVDLPHIQSTYSIKEILPTEIEGLDGMMTKSRRMTEINLYESNGQQAWLYEMGIPVVEIEGVYHVNIMQKVPLSFDRDNVTPSYLGRIYALVLDTAAVHLDANDANQAWVREAIQSNPEMICDTAIRAVVQKRFGDKVVSYDPSDPEANSLAVAVGYQVVHGGTMSREEWSVVRRAEAIKPAGQVTPSKPEGTVPKVIIPMENWTDGMLITSLFTKDLAKRIMGVDLTVEMSNNPTTNQVASYLRVNDDKAVFDFNVGRLGYDWFTGSLQPIIDLIIHEFGHQYSGNHLSSEYYHALTKLGAQFTMLAYAAPSVFRQMQGLDRAA